MAALESRSAVGNFALGKRQLRRRSRVPDGQPATATVTAENPVRALVFDKSKLSQFFRNEADVAGLIYQLLGRELAHKMKISNRLISTVGP